MIQNKFLVIGGAGYIGSHMVKHLIEHGHQVVVLDDLSSGHADALLGGELLVHDFADRPFLDELFTKHHFDGVFHFASQILVGESVNNPAKYYRANTFATLVLLEAMRDHGVQNFVFSSTAAVYGEPAYVPIDEAHPKIPLNPYGASKYMVEQILSDFDRAHGTKYVALRYFNAAGADPQARMGERHEPETHLVPLALQAVTGRRPALKVFGTDYDTPDGTCLRDYIHVDDLSSAHLLAMQYLQAGGASRAFNLGNGAGYSVQQVIDVAGKVAGKPVPVEYAPRRAGDPARLIADATQAKAVLGWEPQYDDLEAIIGHAWAWEQKSH
ncbi:UDP-glucose 4-epimerase GalE [Methylobacillus flagellatus]|uniref:UDP-glucose 4-epimerase GalE n=1 Tax=Methylobacillus flagellatus TaxID=405 RepID=UPI0010F7D97B|nr:UDP-glucose 4-epimerase GalE [Methylobacillus flagellatus]